MTNVSSWAIQYCIVALVALFAGPVLSKLPVAQSFPVPLFDLSGPQTIRLLVEEAGLLMLCMLAIRALNEMPNDRQGFSFLRQLVLPVTILFVVITTDNTLRAVGPSLLDTLGPSRYAIISSVALTVAGLWITTIWLLNFDALQRYCSSQPLTHTRRELERSRDHREEIHPDEEQDEVQTPLHIPTAQTGPPNTLGRYKVLKELGRGSMGVVYLGKDPTIHRFVAIKTMRLDEIEDLEQLQDIRARFFREAESTGRLSHPNIVTIFDAGEEQDLGYIAMEVLEGTTLKEWSRKPRLMPCERLIPILATVADAMDYAHQHGIVHRDIKPANIMLVKNQVVKIMDFGIAKMASSSKTQTDIVMGTPVYMSPEQIAGKKVDGRSDIFSLAVVMFELLTGRPPFLADNVSALLFAIAHTPHPDLAALRPDLPRTVVDVVNRALHKDPVHRYRRAGDFAQELRACLEQMAA